eukprot:scaffold86_cov338-Pavlova_lutheri.AAC.123
MEEARAHVQADAPFTFLSMYLSHVKFRGFPWQPRQHSLSQLRTPPPLRDPPHLPPCVYHDPRIALTASDRATAWTSSPSEPHTSRPPAPVLSDSPAGPPKTPGT